MSSFRMKSARKWFERVGRVCGEPAGLKICSYSRFSFAAQTPLLVPSAKAHPLTPNAADFSGALPDTNHRDAKGAKALLPPNKFGGCHRDAEALPRTAPSEPGALAAPRATCVFAGCAAILGRFQLGRKTQWARAHFFVGRETGRAGFLLGT
jgi:hypothetical protein